MVPGPSHRAAPRTNPNSLNERHLATVYHDIEELLLRSFKMDPTHYGAYDSYHLFLTTYDFGGEPHAKEQAVRIANVAIAAASRRTEDPEPWLTAATAGMNLYLMDSRAVRGSGKTDSARDPRSVTAIKIGILPFPLRRNPGTGRGKAEIGTVSRPNVRWKSRSAALFCETNLRAVRRHDRPGQGIPGTPRVSRSRSRRRRKKRWPKADPEPRIQPEN